MNKITFRKTKQEIWQLCLNGRYSPHYYIYKIYDYGTEHKYVYGTNVICKQVNGLDGRYFDTLEEAKRALAETFVLQRKDVLGLDIE